MDWKVKGNHDPISLNVGDTVTFTWKGKAQQFAHIKL